MREPRQLSVLRDSDFLKRGCNAINPLKPPVSELDHGPLPRFIELHQIVDCSCDANNIDRFRSTPASEKEIRFHQFSRRDRYNTTIVCFTDCSQELEEEPLTASSEPLGFASWCSLLSLLLSTGVQNNVACISDSGRLLSKFACFMEDILKVTCSIISALSSHKYRTWNFCQHKSGRVHILDVGRSVEDGTTVVNDSELFDARTCNSCQCNPGRVHMQDIGRTQGLVSAVNACELFDLKSMNLYQCKPCRAHMLHIDRTESKMSAINELHDTKTRNFYRCKPSRAHIDVAMSDGEPFDIQLSDLIALIFRLPILLALISKSITTVFNSTALPVLRSPELLFGETVHLFLLSKIIPQCSKKLLHQCIASVFNLYRCHVWPQCREPDVLQISLRFHPILVSSITKEIESNHTTPTIPRSVLLPEKHQRPSTVKVHRQPLLDVCCVLYNSLSIILLSVLLSSSWLLLLLTLGKLRVTCKLLLAELKSEDVVHLLVIALLLVTWVQLIPAASLTQSIYRPVKLFSSKTIMIVMVTLSCYVKMTGSAPLHLPNLLIRGTAGGNATYTVPLQGSPNTGYCAKITIGLKPYPQEFCVLVDTGSANLAVAGVTHPDINSWFHPEQSNNYTNLGRTVSVSYTAGDWTGILSKDYIAIQGPSNTWYRSVETFFVLITKSQHFFINDADWVGILGMAYSSLAKPDSSVVTFWEALRSATGMKDMFSLQFCPPLDIPLLDITEPQGGTMVLGGLNDTLYRGPLFFTDIVEQRFYNVLVSNLTIGNTSISLDCKEFNNDQSIVDSGTTDIFFPDKVFAEVKNTFIAHFKGGRPLPVPENFWVGGAKLAWPADDKSTIYGAFPSIYLGFATAGNASQEFSLVVTPQIYLRQIEGTSSEQHDTNCYPECDFFTFGIKQRERGTVIGGNVLLGFFSHFDRETQRIGFAKSTCQYQNPHDGVPEIVGPYPRIPRDCQCSNCKPGMPYWEIISYTCGSIVCPLAIISIICAFCGRRCRKQEAREENVGCWKRIAKCCRKSCFHCFSFWKRKSVTRPTPESLEGLLESESGLREASALIVDESEHEGSEENVGCLERFCTSCFCCCQCLWKKSFSLPIPESCEDDQVNRDDISRCSLVEEPVENELVDSACGSGKERERKVEKEGKEPVEGYRPNSAVEETVSSDSKLETSQNLGETCPASADTSEGVPLLEPETTQSRSELALSKHEGSATDKQRSKKVRSRKRPLVEDRQRQVSEQDIDGDEPPKCKSLDRNSTSNTSIAEESSNVPSSSKKSSAIHNTNRCSTVVEQNEAVKQVHEVGGNKYKNVEKASRHVESEPQIPRKTDVKEVRVQIQKHCSSDDGYCSRQTSRQDSQQLGHMESEPQSARKTEFEDIKAVCVQKIQKQSSDSGYCSRQTSRQDSQQLGAEDSLSSPDQTCLVNRQKSADSALGYVPESGSDY